MPFHRSFNVSLRKLIPPFTLTILSVRHFIAADDAMKPFNACVLYFNRFGETKIS